MKGIFSIEYQKTRSKKYERSVNIMMGLPNYSYVNDCHSIWIDNIKDFIRHQHSIDYLLSIILSWKSCSVFLFGEKLTYHYYRNHLEDKVGKYWEYFHWNSTIGYEELPLPFVHYPEQSIGSFIGFSEDVDSEIFFCECQRKSIENYVRLREQESDVNYVGERSYPLGSESFPLRISKESSNWIESPLTKLRFRKNLCFRCNNIISSRNFTETGSEFIKKFGWYVMEEYYRLGIDRLRHVVLPDYSNHDIYCLMRDYFNQLKEHSKRIKQISTMDISIEEKMTLYKTIETPKSPDDKVMMENMIRERMGYRKIGDGWVSETILYNIVSNIYPNEEIIRHFRPIWLDRLEIDIFLPNKRIGFEYQGIQHYQPIEHWGGEEQLKVVQEHDRRKMKLCKENNIQLICIDYDEPLTESHIRDRINNNSNLNTNH